MHMSKDSIWWKNWKILQNFLELNKALACVQALFSSAKFFRFHVTSNLVVHAWSIKYR